MEQAILFYAGWLGHYVGDGSQPLHTTIQYNGWVGPNPHGYTTEPQDSLAVRGAVCGRQPARTGGAGRNDPGQGD